MDSQALVLILAVLTLALLAIMLLTTFMFRMSQSQTSLLVVMISELRSSNQSLLNQLRAQDPYTLLSLNAATLSSTSNEEEGYISHSDADEVKRFAPGIGDELTQEDFDAFGERYFPEADRVIS